MVVEQHVHPAGRAGILQARQDEAGEETTGRRRIARAVQADPVGLALVAARDVVLEREQGEPAERDHEQRQRDGAWTAQVDGVGGQDQHG